VDDDTFYVEKQVVNAVSGGAQSQRTTSYSRQLSNSDQQRY